jgi:hypothetical protein
MSLTSKHLIEDFAEIIRNGGEFTFEQIKDWFYHASGRLELNELQKEKLTRMNILRVRRYLLKEYGLEWNFVRSADVYKILELADDWIEVTGENYNNLKGRLKTGLRRYRSMVSEHPKMLRDVKIMSINASLEAANQLLSGAENKLDALESGEE